MQYSIVMFPPGAPVDQFSYLITEINKTVYECLKRPQYTSPYTQAVSDMHYVVLTREGDQFVMYGFRGKHALNVACTDYARLKAHWEGFCEINAAACRKESIRCPAH